MPERRYGGLSDDWPLFFAVSGGELVLGRGFKELAINGCNVNKSGYVQ